MSIVRFVYKGGPGSGHHGHAGRPGKVGGSSGRVSTMNFFTGKHDGYDPGDAIIDMYKSTIEDVSKLTGDSYDDVMFIVNERVMGDILGTRTTIKQGDLKGTPAIVLSPKSIQEAVTKHGSYLSTWLGIEGEVTFDNVFKHVVAHEIGHHFYRKQDLQNSWNSYISANWNKASAQARSVKLPEEAFADMFAGYVLGYAIDQGAEDYISGVLP